MCACCIVLWGALGGHPLRIYVVLAHTFDPPLGQLKCHVACAMNANVMMRLILCTLLRSVVDGGWNNPAKEVKQQKEIFCKNLM